MTDGPTATTPAAPADTAPDADTTPDADTAPDADALKAQVRAKYADLAGTARTCCGPSASASSCVDVSESYATLDGYVADADLGLGCGLPTQHAGLAPGDTVLDLGAGAGIDAFTARAEVGPTGRVLGVDMTPAMVDKARANARALGFDNVDFRLGEIEALPVADATIDVVVSNCVLNLVPDKARAFAEIARVLRPGGHFCVSDIVTTGPLPEALRADAELYVGCIAGALTKADYLGVIAAAGFTGVTVAAERPITLPDEVLRAHLSEDALAAFRADEPHVLSVTVRAAKPAA